MNIRPDLIVHAKGGLLVAAGCTALAWLALAAGLSPLSTAILTGTFAGAVSVEAAQWAANRAARAAGQPERHEISALDAAASFAPAVPAAAGIEILLRWPQVSAALAALF